MALWSKRDWIDAQVVTEAQLQAEFDAIYNSFAWDLTWVPAITATSLNVTYTLQEGRYIQINKTVFAKATIVLNVVTNAGSGDYTINLPVDPRVPASGLVDIGAGRVYDVSTTTRSLTTVERTGASAAKLGRDGSSGFVTAAAPFAWATGDQIILRLEYEAA